MTSIIKSLGARYCEFISRAKEIHGDKYDYSKVEYVNNHTKVEIICKEHGSFFQRPDGHINRKNGCPYCSGHKGHTLERFISRAKEIHGDKYDYSKVNFINNTSKVEIICREHGSFYMNPIVHMNGSICRSCYGTKKLTIEEFISRAKEIHGDKYDYSKVEYVNTHTKVEIICPIHGNFFQKPDKHLVCLQGCPKCTTRFSSYEKVIYNLLKSLSMQFTHQDKSILKPKELDFYIPSLNLAIEINGGYWHRNQNTILDDRTYHIKNKYMMLKDLNIDLINLYDKDFYNKDLTEESKERILNRILLSSYDIPIELYDNNSPIINNDLGYSILLKKYGYVLKDYDISSIIYSKNKLYVVGSGYSIVENPT